jgi:hypothetical protein
MKLETLGVTTLARINKILDAVKLHSKDKDEESVEITMEFLVGSLFPELFKNFQAKISEEYQRGFREGYTCGIESNWEDFTTTLRNLDIALHDAEGNFRNTYEVLSEIADKWKEVKNNNETN